MYSNRSSKINRLTKLNEEIDRERLSPLHFLLKEKKLDEIDGIDASHNVNNFLRDISNEVRLAPAPGEVAFSPSV